MATKEELDERIIAAGKRLRELRIEAGYTSYENFAFENELPRVQYGRMEKGTNFTIKSLLKVLDVHGLTLNDFFSSL